MNANENAPKANARLKRIKTVSRIVKWAIFAFGSLPAIILLFSVIWLHKTNFWHDLFILSFLTVACIWYWKLTRLFHFYEQGLIFAAETIRCIKLLGILWLIGWVFITGAHFAPHQTTTRADLQSSAASSPAQPVNSESVQPPSRDAMPVTHTAPVVVSRSFLRIGFFTFDFGLGIDFGMPLGAVIIILIAWIMDEGRKIQEEQELTV